MPTFTNIERGLVTLNCSCESERHQDELHQPDLQLLHPDPGGLRDRRQPGLHLYPGESQLGLLVITFITQLPSNWLPTEVWSLTLVAMAQ